MRGTLRMKTEDHGGKYSHSPNAGGSKDSQADGDQRQEPHPDGQFELYVEGN